MHHTHSRPSTGRRLLSISFLVAGLILPLGAQDWPEWRGRGRGGVWTESGIVERFEPGGLQIGWRTPIRSGYAGPAVSEGRVFVLDFQPDPESTRMEGTERVVCLDEATGKILWTREWTTGYSMLMASYAIGPRATPTVDGDRVYVVGATGILRCLDTATGRVLWGKDYVADYGTTLATWGVSSAPLVDGPRLICIVGGEPDAKVVAFDKRTGKELWRALSSDWEMGYAQPIMIQQAGLSQLIIWQPKAVSALNPETGLIYWEVPFDVGIGMTVATPVHSGPYLVVSQFYGGSMALQLDSSRPGATMLWKGSSRSELPDQSDGLHSLITTPVIRGETLFGVCSYGQLRGLDLRTGKRLWESQKMTEYGRWSAAFLVRHEDRYFVNNDSGDLIIARLSSDGYQELDRTRLIEPTTQNGRGAGRSRRPVNWSHPAYANRHIIARNDKEILRASLSR